MLKYISSTVVIKLLSLVIFIFFWLFLHFAGQDFAVYFMDVGHGDAILIRTPNRKLILIDGGPDNSVLHELGGILDPFTRGINVVIATHMHADHIGGLLGVLEKYTVDNVIVNPKSYDSPVAKAFLQHVDKGDIRLQRMVQGDTFMIDDVVITCIWPNTDALLAEDINNSSYVFLLEYQGFRVLLTSDAEFAGQYSADIRAELMKVGDVDVLKVPHQGSMNSLSAEALDIIRPEISVLSVGKNSYGHPHKQTITTLFENNSEVIMTETNGTIKIYMDKNRLHIKTYK